MVELFPHVISIQHIHCVSFDVNSFIHFYLMIGKPSCPENLHVVWTDKGCVSLEWQPGKERSLTPVDGYIIEMAEDDSKDFTEVGRVDGGTCKFDAIGLQDGQKYNFQVKAENQTGTSEGSVQLGKPVIASEVGKGRRDVVES